VQRQALVNRRCWLLVLLALSTSLLGILNDSVAFARVPLVQSLWMTASCCLLQASAPVLSLCYIYLWWLLTLPPQHFDVCFGDGGSIWEVDLGYRWRVIFFLGAPLQQLQKINSKTLISGVCKKILGQKRVSSVMNGMSRT
jgi:hypothetical protein